MISKVWTLLSKESLNLCSKLFKSSWSGNWTIESGLQQKKLWLYRILQFTKSFVLQNCIYNQSLDKSSVLSDSIAFRYNSEIIFLPLTFIHENNSITLYSYFYIAPVRYSISTTKFQTNIVVVGNVQLIYMYYMYMYWMYMYCMYMNWMYMYCVYMYCMYGMYKDFLWYLVCRVYSWGCWKICGRLL